MNIFFIGMGNMGQQRLHAVSQLKEKYDLNVVGFYDPFVEFITFDKNKIYSADDFSAESILSNKIDLFIIGTPHNLIYDFIKTILLTKLPLTILVEKPLGLNFDEAKKIKELKQPNQNIYVGLNYRFYKGINMLIKDIRADKFGTINSLSISMGHGHGSKFKNSWNVDKDKAGGGVIIDPGIHVINLMQLFSKSKIKLVSSHLTKMNFWKTGIEEQCNLLFSSDSIPLIHLNISILKWRSNFNISLFGNENYGIIQGRGSHYGNQTYSFGSRWAWENSRFDNQIDTETVKSESNESEVFTIEIENILKHLNKKELDILPCEIDEALESMKLIAHIYQNG
tara:strand:+ start:895 stop:1911 length:1017 start_codon:yes stop_codon:yes gene_type:complete